MLRDRAFMERLIERAKAAGCSALVLTLDLQILGQRHKDLKNGLTAPPKPTVANLLNLATKPRWCWNMLQTKRRTFGNIVGHAKGVDDPSSLFEWTAQQFDPTLSWRDVEWVKSRWGGPLVLKGILDVEDARLAAASGADAIVVSNHGGRQLDGAPSSISALPAIVEAVGSQIEVWLDGGIRSGQDVLKAWALGARGTLIGRAFLYGLGAMGEAGVTGALEIIARELELTMAFCGHTDIRNVDSRVLLPGRFRCQGRRHDARAVREAEDLAPAPSARAADREARVGHGPHVLARRLVGFPSAVLIHAGGPRRPASPSSSCRALRRAAPAPAPRRHPALRLDRRARPLGRHPLLRGVAPSKVLQRSTLPPSTPRLNQLTRCALVPVRERLGNDRALRRRCSVSSPICEAALSAVSMSPGSSRQPFSFCERAAQTPAKQSACSSTRTLSAFACAPPLRPRSESTFSMMPSWFWTWWPTSWATT
jgi:hypothetical protein